LCDPGILHEIPVAVRGLHHDVRTKPSDLEPTVRIHKTETIVFHGRFSDLHIGAQAKGDRIAAGYLDTGAKAAIKFHKLALFIS
jgi:hypothetical protein